jgi:two-component system, cell cycle sensor histidine kinase and response regulator CckA
MPHHLSSDPAQPDDSPAALRARIAALESRLEDVEGLLEHFPGVIARFDRHHRHRFVSASIARVTGLPAASFLGKTNQDLGMPADLVAQWDAALAEVFATGQPVRTQFAFPSMIVGVQYYAAELVPEHSPDGTVTTVLAVTREVTERVRAEALIAAREAVLKGLFDHAPSVILVKDRAGRYLMVNQRLAAVIGREPDQILGKTVHDLFPPEIAAAMEAHDRKVFASGQALTIEEQIPIEGVLKTQLAVLFPIADAEGQISSLGLIATDITERMQMEAALRAQEATLARERAFLDAVLESLDEGVAVSDTQGQLQFTNQALERMTSYLRGGPVPPGLAALLAEGQQEPPEGLAQPAIPARPGMQNELRELVSLDGERRQLLVSQQWRIRNDQPLLVTSIRDVTAQREAEARQRGFEQKLQEAQRLEMLGVLAGGIAHDFNNLLAVILGNADLVLDEMPPDAPAQASLRQIVNAARQGAELSRQMLTYAGRGQLFVERIDLNEVIQNDRLLLDASIKKGARLRLDLAPQLPPIMADLSQIRQVVINLIVNASEALSGEEGTITVTTECVTRDAEASAGEDLPAGTYVQLSVHDSGIGIDPAVLNRIFDPFFSTRFTGRGLGLAVVRSIVERHQGRIWATSRAGEGTTFTVLLPATPAAAEPEAPQHWHRGKLVLVVDDDVRVQSTAAAMLRRLGFTPILARTGAAALAEVRARGDDLAVVLLDLAITGIHGKAGLKAIRQIAPDLPVVVMSAYSMTDAAQQGVGHGAAGFLQKPFTLRSLRAHLYALGPDKRPG